MFDPNITGNIKAADLKELEENLREGCRILLEKDHVHLTTIKSVVDYLIMSKRHSNPKIKQLEEALIDRLIKMFTPGTVIRHSIVRQTTRFIRFKGLRCADYAEKNFIHERLEELKQRGDKAHG